MGRVEIVGSPCRRVDVIEDLNFYFYALKTNRNGRFTVLMTSFVLTAGVVVANRVIEMGGREGEA